MCNECLESARYGWFDITTGEDMPVPLTRRHPKNKGQTPADWLIGHNEFQGDFDLVSRSPVFDGDRQTVGWYISYRGARRKSYNSPMFGYKSAGDETCTGCERQITRYWIEHHPKSRTEATRGCLCGDISRLGPECEEHPVPKVNSRWIVHSQEPQSTVCNSCKKYLPDENTEHFSYCNDECFKAYRDAYEKRSGRPYPFIN